MASEGDKTGDKKAPWWKRLGKWLVSGWSVGYSKENKLHVKKSKKFG